jgi:hypothetical protein
MLSFTASTQAIEYGGIGGRPAYPRADVPRSSSIFIHQISPNQTIDEGIKVINNSQEVKNLLIYTTDETPSTDGGFACRQFSESVDNVGKWIQLEKSTLTLEAMSSEIIPFTITAPEEATVGEHNGCIIVQESKDRSQEAGLKLSFRTGIRVALTIPGEIIRLLEIIDFKITDKKDNAYVLTPTIKNLGNSSTDANIKVIVTNRLTHKTQELGGNYAVLRNNPLVLNFDFKKPFWGGRYSAKTIVSYEDGTQAQVLESTTLYFDAWPTEQAQIYLISTSFALILLLIILFVSNKIKKKKLATWQIYQIKDGDNLNKILKGRKGSWKEVAKINHLRPPYNLKVGKQIKVPPYKAHHA